MSKALITEQQALDHLRIDADAEPNLALYVEAASEAVLSIMGAQADFLLDSSGDVVADTSGPLDVPAKVKQATLITLTSIYEDRKGDSGDKNAQWGAGKLPGAAMSLLRDYYTPAI
jgi:hypothetical protein